MRKPRLQAYLFEKKEAAEYEQTLDRFASSHLYFYQHVKHVRMP